MSAAGSDVDERELPEREQMLLARLAATGWMYGPATGWMYGPDLGLEDDEFIPTPPRKVRRITAPELEPTRSVEPTGMPYLEIVEEGEVLRFMVHVLFEPALGHNHFGMWAELRRGSTVDDLKDLAQLAMGLHRLPNPAPRKHMRVFVTCTATQQHILGPHIAYFEPLPSDLCEATALVYSGLPEDSDW